MTILVTGADGFLGQAVHAACPGALAVRHASRYAFAGATAHVDLASREHVERLVADAGPVSAVVHCAAVTPFNRPGAFDDAPNRLMTENVIRLCNALRPDRLLFTSGWVVYAIDSVPVPEAARCAPATPYGESKLRAEHAFRAGLRDTAVVCARLSAVYGPGQTSPGLIPNLVSAGLTGGPLRTGDPDIRRDYLHVADAATALRRLLELARAEHIDVNVGSGASVAIGDVARLVQRIFAEALGVEVALEHAAPGTGASPRDNRLDTSLARRLGIAAPPRALATGLRDYVAWRARVEAERRRAR